MPAIWLSSYPAVFGRQTSIQPDSWLDWVKLCVSDLNFSYSVAGWIVRNKLKWNIKPLGGMHDVWVDYGRFVVDLWSGYGQSDGANRDLWWRQNGLWWHQTGLLRSKRIDSGANLRKSFR